MSPMPRHVRRRVPFPTSEDPWLLAASCESCGLDGWWDRRVGTVAHGHRVCVVQAVEWPEQQQEAA